MKLCEGTPPGSWDGSDDQLRADDLDDESDMFLFVKAVVRPDRLSSEISEAVKPTKKIAPNTQLSGSRFQSALFSDT